VRLHHYVSHCFIGGQAFVEHCFLVFSPLSDVFDLVVDVYMKRG
jgi:hypothetical protein